MPATALLELLNFFLADVRDGLGPYLATFLAGDRGWDPASIGLTMTVVGLAAVALQTPAGILVDRVDSKRLVLAVACICVLGGCLALLVAESVPAVAGSQLLAAGAGTLIPPAVAAATLGMAGQARFAAQLGRNEACNHAGNMVAALGAGLLATRLGFNAVFWLMGGMALASLASIAAIPPGAINPGLARGAASAEAGQAGLLATLGDRRLLGLAVTLALFHLGNAAMLPLLGQRLAAASPDEATTWMSACIIIAQGVMAPISYLAGRHADRIGHRRLVLVALAALPVRGALAAWSADPWMLLPIQALDALGAGTLGVAVPLLVAELVAGSGRFNASLGAVATIQSIGAACSTALGGVLAQEFGWAAAFLGLAAPALVAVSVFLAATRTGLSPRPMRVTAGAAPAAPPP